MSTDAKHEATRSPRSSHLIHLHKLAINSLSNSPSKNFGQVACSIAVDLFLPCSINTPRTPDISIFHRAHPSPLLSSRAINKATRFDCNPFPCTHRWRFGPIGFVELWNLNALACIKLKCWLCTVHFKMQASLRVGEAAQLPQWQRACI